MAEAAPAAVNQRVERLLESLTREWARLPDVEARIGGWDLLEQVDFVEEWALVGQKLRELAHLADEGHLTAEQKRRYAALRVLIARHNPIVERLRAS